MQKFWWKGCQCVSEQWENRNQFHSVASMQFWSSIVSNLSSLSYCDDKTTHDKDDKGDKDDAEISFESK